MATLSVQTYDESGTDLTMSAAAAGGDQFANTGKEILIITNGDGSAHTATITAQTTSYEFGLSGDVTKSNQSVQVSAGGAGVIGPFPKDAFNDSNGNVQITYDAVTSVEVAVVRED